MTRRRSFVFFVPVLLLVLAALLPLGAISRADAQSPGYASRMPVCAGATKINPWGALCDIVATAVAPYGWNVKVCYNCAGGIKEVIDVETKLNTSTVTAVRRRRSSGRHFLSIAEPIDRRRRGARWISELQRRISFGGPTQERKPWRGVRTAASYTDLRLVATIVKPLYLVVAARQASGYTDLSQVAAQSRRKSGPRPLGQWHNERCSPSSLGLLRPDKSSITAVGGAVTGNNATAQADFDVIIYTADLSEAPEFNVLYIVTQTTPLTFIPLPAALLTQLEQTYDMVPLTAPIGFVKWMWQPYVTVGFNGDAVFGRSDMPDQFAYDLAKGIDERKDLWKPRMNIGPTTRRQVWRLMACRSRAGQSATIEKKGT